MKRYGVYLLTLALAAAAPAAAQNGPPAGARPPGPGGIPQQGGLELRGAVRDAATGAPLTAASIAVRSAADSSLVTGVVTRPDGTFRVEGLRPGAYYLRVSQLGYTTGTVSRVALTPGTPVADVGEVKLTANAVALQGIEATAERAAVTTAVDRNVYSARDLPAASGGNATDVLRNVPSVEVDGDGKVSLRGQENVAVQINGRPAPLRGDALANFLKQLPANMVERVEVVPNPSAKFDPDGMGGIINIVMKQNADLGLSGGLSLSAGTGDKYNGNGNLGYQRGPLTLFGSYGLYLDQRSSTGYNHRENLLNGAPMGFVNQTIDGEFDNVSHTFNGSADLRLGPKTSVASSLMYSSRNLDVLSSNFFSELDADRAPVRSFTELTRNGMDNGTADASLSFKHTFQPQKHEFSAEARFNRVSDQNQQRYSTLFGNEETPARATDLDATYRDLSFQADYTRPLSSTLKLETGYKGILRRVDNDFVETRAVGGGDTDNAFTYDEDIHAGYGLLTQDFGKLDLQAGLRVESVQNTFDLATTDQQFDNDYTSLFPSAAATLELGGQRQLRASYARRIQRPDVRLLNPFPFAEDQYNRFQGNPELRPEYTNSFELSLQQSTAWGSLQLSPFYRHTTDAVRRFRTVIPDSGISVATFRNLAEAKHYGADMNVSVRMGRLNGFTSLSGFRMESHDEASGVGTESFSWSARASLSYKLTPSTEVSWFQMYRGPMNLEGGRISGFSMSNFSLRQKFWGEKASLSMRLADPFDQMGFTHRSFDAVHTQESRRKWGARAAFVTFQYNFGQAPRIRPQRQPQPDQQSPSPDMPVGN